MTDRQKQTQRIDACYFCWWDEHVTVRKHHLSAVPSVCNRDRSYMPVAEAASQMASRAHTNWKRTYGSRRGPPMVLVHFTITLWRHSLICAGDAYLQRAGVRLSPAADYRWHQLLGRKQSIVTFVFKHLEFDTPTQIVHLKTLVYDIFSSASNTHSLLTLGRILMPSRRSFWQFPMRSTNIYHWLVRV